MSIAAAGYVLKVPSSRRKLLLNESASGGSFYRSSPFVSEPVPTFDLSRRAPLIVFASFENGKITHIADGKRGAAAGTRLARLNMQDLKTLTRPIRFDELQSGVPKRLQPHLKRILAAGGILPPKTLGAFVDRIVELDASVGGRLARFSDRRREALRSFEPRALENLAYQKETLGLALEISGISKDELLAWQPHVSSQSLFWMAFPGRKFGKMPCCWRISRQCPASRLLVKLRTMEQRRSRKQIARAFG